MAYYYFFETSEQNREGEIKPTLRALSGQTFPDGTPVSTTLNVQAPKTPKESPYGNRLDYPNGTVFCSDHLEYIDRRENGTPCSPYYSVYDKFNRPNSGNYPNFHPVSTDGNFVFKELGHCNDDMNRQYALFLAGLGQGTPDDDTDDMDNTDTTTRPARLAPADENGHARPFENDWTERYEGQLEIETDLLKNWMVDYHHSKGISGRVLMDSYKGTLNNLYKAGETIDSIANTKRLESVINSRGQSLKDISIMQGGIFGFYVKSLYEEHQKGSKCSAVARSAADPDSIQEAANVLCKVMNDKYGGSSLSNNKTALDNLKKAFEAGWTLDDCMEPSINDKAQSYPELVKALADGTIPLNKATLLQGGVSRLEMLLTDPKNARPSDKDGFHINEETWNELLFALYGKHNTMLVGPSGTGKTEVIIKLCEQTGTPFTLIQMGGITDPYEQLVLGKDLANNGTETVDNWADFALAIQRPGVIILDEVNRIPRHGSNTLFSCLDGMKVLSAPTAKDPAMKQIKVHPECVFFATANIGAEYTDTSQIDEALRNRFGLIEVDYLSQKEEQAILRKRTGIAADDAKNISFIADRIRQMARKSELSCSVSTRDTIRIAEKVAFGFSCQSALETSLLPNFDRGTDDSDNNSERAKVKLTIQTRFNNKASA